MSWRGGVQQQQHSIWPAGDRFVGWIAGCRLIDETLSGLSRRRPPVR